jgi:hypothetical protein
VADRRAASGARLNRNVRLHMDNQTYANADRLRLASWFVVVAWALLLVLIAYFALSAFSPLRATWPANDLVFVILLCLFLASALAYCFLALSLRCPSCGRRFLVEWLGPKHPNARRLFGMDHWASAIVDVLRRGHCSCMHCGSTISVR